RFSELVIGQFNIAGGHSNAPGGLYATSVYPVAYAVIGHLAPALVVFVSAVILTTFCLKWLLLATIGFLYVSSSVPRSVARAHLGTLKRNFQSLEIAPQRAEGSSGIATRGGRARARRTREDQGQRWGLSKCA